MASMYPSIAACRCIELYSIWCAICPAWFMSDPSVLKVCVRPAALC